MKSIIIEEYLHKKFKTFCRGKNLKIGAVVEDLMTIFLNKYEIIQPMIDKFKKEKSDTL